MLDDVCMYIANNYEDNSHAYFEQEDAEEWCSKEELYKLIKDKFDSVFGDNIKITENSNQYKNSYMIVYNDVSGELYEYFDSRGNSYWVVSFIVE